MTPHSDDLELDGFECHHVRRDDMYKTQQWQTAVAAYISSKQLLPDITAKLHGEYSDWFTVRGKIS